MNRFARAVFSFRRWTFIGATLVLLVSPLRAQQVAQQELPQIETVGTGERRVSPDRATVQVVIDAKATSASLAASANARALQKVMDTLKTLGLEAAAKTSSYSVSPNYERRLQQGSWQPVREGYQARTTLRIRLNKLSDVGPVIDAALAKGATGVEGVMFETSTLLESRRGALADAAAAARADAEALAIAMGGSLGPLLSTSTAANNDPRRANVFMPWGSGYGRTGSVSSMSTELTPNEIVIAAGVVARWRFVPAR